MFKLVSFVFIGLCIQLIVPGCGDDDSGNTGGDTDSDSDNDTDSDSDSDSDGDTDTELNLYGEVHEGQYHLGPVDFAETEWHNACAPLDGYRPTLWEGTGLGGEYLAGVSNSYIAGGAVCDSCIFIQTAKGFDTIARVVTYGVTNEPGDIDVSPSVYDLLNQGEYPRTMTWQYADCPDTGTLHYEFQTESNIWWTSFWVRNQRVPITMVEVRSVNHENYFELQRSTDGSLVDSGGFGEGEFTLRLTAMDGQIIEDTFQGFTAGELIVSNQQF